MAFSHVGEIINVEVQSNPMFAVVKKVLCCIKADPRTICFNFSPFILVEWALRTQQCTLLLAGSPLSDFAAIRSRGLRFARMLSVCFDLFFNDDDGSQSAALKSVTIAASFAMSFCL